MIDKMRQSSRQLSIVSKIAFSGFSLQIDEQIELQGVTGLFGPSGGGKSTLLRVIAGLECNSGGSVTFDGETWQDDQRFLHAYERPVGYVFQDARLFPHLDVEGNLLYAFSRNKSRHKDGQEIAVSEVVAAMDLRAFMRRRVTTLSGGERQRVAIARTLLTNPKLLLLDEPLAALDEGRKQEILPYLDALNTRFSIPAIYVSHSAVEMARLADNVVLLEAGQVVANESAQKILSRDGLHTTAMPFEAVSILPTTVIEIRPQQHLMKVDHKGQILTVPAVLGVEEGETVRLSIRSADVILATSKPEGLSVRNVLFGRVNRVTENGENAFGSVTVDVHGAMIKAQLTAHAIQELKIAVGLDVYVLLKVASFDRPL